MHWALLTIPRTHLPSYLHPRHPTVFGNPCRQSLTPPFIDVDFLGQFVQDVLAHVDG